MPPASAQVTDGLDGVQNFYLSQGVLGVSCVMLALVIILLWRHILKLQVDHKAELDARDKLIYQLQEDRLAEAKAASEVVHKAQNTATLEAFIDMMNRGRS
jgi:hypothetical protein